MAKNILSIIIGILVGGFVIYLVQSLGHLVYPTTENLDSNDIEALKEQVMRLPAGAFLFVLLAYALGSFAGGLATALLAKKRELRSAMVVGGILMFFGLINLIMIPHPIWFSVVSVVLYIPCAYAGGSLAMKRKGNSAAED